MRVLILIILGSLSWVALKFANSPDELRIVPLRETSLVLNATELVEIPIPESKTVKIKFYQTSNLRLPSILFNRKKSAENTLKRDEIEKVFTKSENGIYLYNKDYLWVFPVEQYLLIQSDNVSPGETVTVKLESGTIIDLKLCPSSTAHHTEISIIPRGTDPQECWDKIEISPTPDKKKSFDLQAENPRAERKKGQSYE